MIQKIKKKDRSLQAYQRHIDSKSLVVREKKERNTIVSELHILVLMDVLKKERDSRSGFRHK